MVYHVEGYFPCRCKNYKCRARTTLRHHPVSYINRQLCKQCRSPLRLDGHRKKKPKTDAWDTCYCDGAHFLHRRGSMRLCRFYEDFKLGSILRGTARGAQNLEPIF